MTTSTNMLPGMADANVEFFINTEDELNAIHKGKVIEDFADLPFFVVDILRNEVSFSPRIEEALMEFHPDDETQRLKQLAKCRFGGLDYVADIQDGLLQDGEYWPCPLHGMCKHEGVLCKLPIIEGQRLTSVEVKLMKLLCTDHKNSVIALEMGVPEGTFHLLKKNLYKKTNVQTKQEIALIAKSLNLV